MKSPLSKTGEAIRQLIAEKLGIECTPDEVALAWLEAIERNEWHEAKCRICGKETGDLRWGVCFECADKQEPELMKGKEN